MADTPLYTAREGGPQAPGLSPGVVPIPNLPGGEVMAQATGRLGSTLGELGAKIYEGQQETQVALARTGYTTELDALREKYANSQDFQNAPGNFARERADIEQKYLGEIADPHRRAVAQLHMRTQGLSAGREVSNAARGLEDDANKAGLNVREQDYLRRAAIAASPVERASVLKDWHDDIDRVATAGWITARDAASRKTAGLHTLAQADVIERVRVNPRQVLYELQDPEQYKDLGPAERANLLYSAQRAVDRVTLLELQNRAERDPAGAIGSVGLAPTAAEGRIVYQRGILPVEGGERAGVALTSPKGALGLAQILPDTARATATRLGMKDVAGLDDTALTARLLSDRDLNYKLGEDEWQRLVTRYGGNIWAAAAGYNAGTGAPDRPRADAWMREAAAKFGPGFSPEQFASVIPIKETRDYVLKVAERLNVDPRGPGFSNEAQLHAGLAIRQTIQQQDNERIAAIRGIAKVGRETDEPATLFKAGYNIDPAGYAVWSQQQFQAAATGDVTAAKALRDAEFQRQMLPFVQTARQTAPALLETFVRGEEARLATSPNVSIDEKNRLDVARTWLGEIATHKNSDPVSLGETANLFAPVAFDPKADPGAAAFRGTLNARGVQAERAAEFYQGAVLPLKPQEAAALKTRYAAASEDEKFRLVDGMAQSLQGPAYEAALGQIGGADVAMVGRLARTRPALARDVLHGQSLIESANIDKKNSVVREALRARLGAEIYPAPDMQGEVENAALALYANDRGAAALYDAADGGAMEKAIEKITGPIIKRNGRRVPAPPGMSAAVFEYALDNLDRASVDAAGGAVDRNGKPFDPRELGQRAQLVPLGIGAARYAVLMPTPDGKGAPVMTLDAGPLVLNMEDVAKRYRAALTTTNIEMMRAVREQFNIGATLP